MRLPSVFEALRNKHTHTHRSAWKHYAVGGGCCADVTTFPFQLLLCLFVFSYIATITFLITTRFLFFF